MHLTNQIHPTKEQFRKLVASYPKDTPVTMINVLKFKGKTGNGNETGVEAYTRYGLNTLPFMKKHGAKLIWRGQVKGTLIGDDQDQAHVVMLVKYPTLQNFIDMTSDPEYVKVSKDRTIALEYGGLWASEEEYLIGSE